MTQEKKKVGTLGRVIAALLALIVIGGSLFFLFAPGRNGGNAIWHRPFFRKAPLETRDAAGLSPPAEISRPA